MANYRRHKKVRYSDESQAPTGSSDSITGALCVGCNASSPHTLGHAANISGTSPSCDLLSNIIQDAHDKISQDPNVDLHNTTHEPLTLMFSAQAVHAATNGRHNSPVCAFVVPNKQDGHSWFVYKMHNLPPGSTPGLFGELSKQWGELAHGDTLAHSTSNNPLPHTVLRISFGHILKNIAEGGLKFVGNLAGSVVNGLAGKALGGLL